MSVNNGGSAYGSSKIAQVKMLEHLATENPELFVASVHPGVFPTDMAAGLDMDESNIPVDDRKSNHFCLPVKIWANKLMPHNWWRVEDPATCQYKALPLLLLAFHAKTILI